MSSLTVSAPNSLELGEIDGVALPRRNREFSPARLDTDRLKDCRTVNLLLLFQAIGKWRHERQRRRLAVQELMTLDERVLRDIGLDRIQALYTMSLVKCRQTK